MQNSLTFPPPPIMNYNQTIQRIQNIPILSRHIQNMELTTNYLNLVVPEWESVLKATDVYDKHAKRSVRYANGRQGEKKFCNQNVLDMDDYYNVIVAGYWHFAPLTDQSETVTIVCRQCKPLSLIGESMSENNMHIFRSNSRFFIESCDGSICAACQSCSNKSLSLEYPTDNWCIQSTRIFDGQNVKNMLKCQILKVFSNGRVFNGILRLSVKSRCKFGDNCYKIGGVCKEMLIFPDSALNMSTEEAIRLALPPSFNNTPTIEYPKEDQKY